MAIRAVKLKEGFPKSFKRLPPDIQQQTLAAIEDLKKEPIPKSRRMNKLKGYRNPNIYAIHVTPQHTHKLTFELEGNIAILRRVGTHKEIDRTP